MRAFVEKHHSRRVDDVRLNTRDVDCFRDVLDPDDVVVGRSTNLFVKSSYYCVSVSVRGRSKKIVPSRKNIISQRLTQVVQNPPLEDRFFSLSREVVVSLIFVANLDSILRARYALPRF